MVKRDQEMILVSKNGVVIRTTLKQVPVQGRSTGGVTVMRLSNDDEVAAIAAFDESISEDDS
jgi:DNA gyrase subunit A